MAPQIRSFNRYNVEYQLFNTHKDNPETGEHGRWNGSVYTVFASQPRGEAEFDPRTYIKMLDAVASMSNSPARDRRLPEACAHQSRLIGEL